MAEEEVLPEEVGARFDAAEEALHRLREVVEADPSLLPSVLQVLNEIVRTSEDVGQEKLGEGQRAVVEGNLEPATPQEEKLLEEIHNGVLGMNIHGKLPQETEVEGLSLIKEGLRTGFRDFGPDKDIARSVWHGRGRVIDQFVGRIYNDGRWRELSELVNSHFVWAVPAFLEGGEEIDFSGMTFAERIEYSRKYPPSPPEIDDQNMVLAIKFFQDKFTPDYPDRQAYTQAYVQVKLPNELAKKVLVEVQENPDLLEKLYQMLFPGLDAQENRPGMRRAAADGVYIISDAEFEKAREVVAFTQTPDGRSSRDLNDDEKTQVTQMVRHFFERLTRYTYTDGPYGTGEAYVGEKL